LQETTERLVLRRSSAGTNLKLGAPMRREAAEMFLVVPLHFFGSKITIIRFGERFCDGQYSLVSYLFAVLLLTVRPCAQPFVKVGGTYPPFSHAQRSRRHCLGVYQNC